MTYDWSTSLVLFIPFVILVLSGIWAIERKLNKLQSKIDQIDRILLRRSVEYMKLENDLVTIMSAIIETTEDKKLKELVANLVYSRHKRLSERLEFGTGASEHLRGLEFPSNEDDPWFNSKNVAELLFPEASLTDPK